MSIKDKVAIITGASSGIGAATAKLFAKEGANVVIIARNEEKLKKVAEDCSKVGNKPLIIKADVSNKEDAKKIIDNTIAKFGKLDILVNNAGILRLGTILDGSVLETYDEVLNTNLHAVVRLTTLAAPYLVKTKGNIVNVSSIASTTCIIEMAAYATSKAGVTHFSRFAALELAQFGVRVNVVSPGPVYTEVFDNGGITKLSLDNFGTQTALKRVSDAVEIADLILFLSCDKAKGITGSDFISDNGFLLNP